MLLLLMPEQISRYWEDIKEGLSRALPPGPSDREAKILVGLQTGRNQCWISYRKDGDGTTVDGGVITALIYDQVHETGNLLIYAVWGLGEVHRSTWVEGLEALGKFAKSRGCSRMIAYSDIPLIISLADIRGGEAKYTFLSWDV